MRITIAALGTRGDVQPMIALGRGLRAAGHDVALIAGSNFGEWVGRHGLRFVPSVDMEALMGSEKGVAWAESGQDPLKQVRMMRDLMTEYGQGMIDPIEACAASSDLMVSSFSAQSLVQAAAEKRGIPAVNALLQPQHPARSGAACLNPIFAGRESALNRWTGLLAERIVWSIAEEVTNRYRAQLGLPAHGASSFTRANRSAKAVMGFSRHVVPPPADWPVDAPLTGYWFLDEDSGWTAPDELAAFLDGGRPPVYVGFGSMSSRDPRGTLALIQKALERSGQRAVVAAGWGDLRGGSLPSNVCLVESAPHEWLFPRMAAVVHHGGAGTTAAGLRAGRPTMVIPHMADQPFWGRRVHEMGVGVAPVPRHKLTPEALAAGLRRLAEDAGIRDRAAAVGEKIRTERGVAAAVSAIESLAA